MFGRLEMGNLDAGELGAAEGAGEAHQQQRPVAQPRQVVADRCHDLAQDADFRRELRLGTLAGLPGQSVEPGERLGDDRRGGGGGASGEVVQIADRGDPQPQRVGRQRFFAVRPVALGGEEGGDVGRPGGQGGQAVSAAPGAPGADTGAVGAARVF